MKQIPLPAIVLTASGALPFVYGALAARGINFGLPIETFEGRWVVYFYGAVILSFMGGALWGFAAKAGKADDWGLLTLSVLPALWAFGSVLFGIYLEPATFRASFYLMAVGFGLALVLDWYFQSIDLAPNWWMTLRIPITLLVITCFIGTPADV